MLLLANGSPGLPGLPDEALAKVFSMQPNALSYLHTEKLNTVQELQNIKVSTEAFRDRAEELTRKLSRLEHGIDLMLRIGVQARQNQLAEEINWQG